MTLFTSLLLALPNCFELFGFDFLVDDDFNVHLIEANAFPDFKQTGQRLNNLISVLFEQTVAVAIDPFFTSTSSAFEEGMTRREVVKENGKLHLVFDRKLFAAN
jgi:hypothetical protein